tara:strand:- start:103 stop:321 length:219 start_codon:yes stop_codon:yes gene_type:complete
MDFLKDLLELNNVIYLTKLAEKQNLDEDGSEQFIQKYNKRNNRLFKPCKKYKIDEYQIKVERYQLSPSSPRL